MKNYYKYNSILNKKSLNFSRWSRKSYAIFVSINKIVKISNLKTEVSQGFIKKSKTLSSVYTLIKSNNNVQEDTPFSINEILIESNLIVLAQLSSKSNKINLSVQNFNLLISILYMRKQLLRIFYF